MKKETTYILGGGSSLNALKLFNEKADKLKNLSFTKYVFEQRTGFTISSQEKGPVKVERRGPDEEAIDAFVLTFRFFYPR